MTRLIPIYVPADGEHGTAPPAYTPPHTQPSTAAITAGDVKLELRPLVEKDGLIVTIEPPLAPQNEKLAHVPCDIVLVIDVSGSMSSEARIPGSSDQESTGLSVLDLVKHACRTILSTLDEHDRLAIITFSNNATEIQGLTVMSVENKKVAEDNIEKMHVQGATNLWAGLRRGLECARSQGQTSRTPAVMLLTDGLPNHMCPPGGYVPALKQMGTIIPTIHTFGFGFQLRSGLLKSIAEFGRGNYSFIPDTGMIGTVFVHAVAHLQSTYATNAVLNLVYPDDITIEQTSGSSVDQQKPIHMVESGRYHLKIPLGNIQYGQSRDIFLRKYNVQMQQQDDMEGLHASIEYQLGSENKFTPHTCRYNGSRPPSYEDAYHVSRHKILAFLASLSPIDPLGEHRTCIPVTSGLQHNSFTKGKGKCKDSGQNQGSIQAEGEGERCEEVYISEPLRQKQDELRDLVANLPAAKFPDDPQCASLMQDLISPEPFGQVSLALSTQAYFERWGQHYLPSIHGAHARQLCNSFKDPGPLQYGLKSPLFIKCRAALNEAFDDLPPPTPSILPVVRPRHPPRKTRRTNHRTTDVGDCSDTEPDGGDLLRSQAYASMSGGRNLRPITSMRDWNNPSGPCFAGCTPVLLSSGVEVPISTLRGGMSVFTPMGPKKVAAVAITPVQRASMVNLEGVLVTPWHPVAIPGQTSERNGKDEWVFPCHASQERTSYTGFIYSVLLQKDKSVDAHAIMLGGGPTGMPFWGVTLGHGILTGADARAHGFFGDYRRVVRNLKRLRPMNDGCVATGGVKRSMNSGLVYGFTKANTRVGPAQGSEVFTTIHASRSFH